MNKKVKMLTLTGEFPLRLTVECALLFSAGLLFSRGMFFASSRPFGISLVSALTGRRSTVFAAAGVVTGCLIRGDLIYAAAVAVLFLTRLVFSISIPSTVKDSREGSSGTVSAGALARSLLRVLSSAKFDEPVYSRMMLGAAAAMITGIVSCVADGYDMTLLASGAVSGVASPVLIYLYAVVLSKYTEGDTPLLKEAGTCALAATAVMSLSGLFPYFDAAIPAAFTVTIFASRYKGLLLGCTYGVVLGAVLSPSASLTYAVAALAAGALWRFSRAAAVASACTASVVWSFYTTGLSALGSVVPELIITSAVLAPLCASSVLPSPKRRAGKVSTTSHERLTLKLRDEAARNRMISLADGMSELSGVLYRLSDKLTSPDTEELCELCETSFEEYCKSCGMKSACFGREGAATSEMQAKMTLALKHDGRVSAALVPEALAKRCYNMGQIIDSMNAGHRRLVSEAKLYDRTGVVAADYEVMSDMLRESSHCDGEEFECDAELTRRLVRRLSAESFKADRTAVFGKRIKKVVMSGVNVGSATVGADEIQRLVSRVCGVEMSSPEFSIDGDIVTMRLSALPKLSVKCGRASTPMSSIKKAKKTGEADGATKIFPTGDERLGIGKTASSDCGDVISAFLTDDGRFFMLISDGMGSGHEAAVTSGICAVFIEKLLRAGSSMDTALKMLNSMMRARNGECSATIDLMELDLMSGNVRFVKSGAAPSFVLRDGRLFRLQSKTVPIGIMRALDAEMIKFEAAAGDIIVMLSDGVAKSFEDCPWLYDLLCDERSWCADMEQMARRIVRCAIENGADDDITAGVVSLSPSKNGG